MNIDYDRMNDIAEMLEKIAAFPDGEIKKNLQDSLFKSLTLGESLLYAILFHADKKADGDSVASESLLEANQRHVEFVISIYEYVGLDLDIKVGDLTEEMTRQLEASQPLFAEMGVLMKKIFAVFNPSDATN